MRLAIATVLALAAATVLATDPGADVAKSYTITARAEPASLKAGGAGVLKLSIDPTGAVHVDPKAPIKVTLSGPAGLTLAKSTLGRAEATATGTNGVRFEAPFTATAAGKQEVKAKLDFFLCTDAWCVKQAREAVIAVDVK